MAKKNLKTPSVSLERKGYTFTLSLKHNDDDADYFYIDRVVYERRDLTKGPNNEPEIALYAEDNGLYYYDVILKNVENNLKDKFIIAFEIGYTQANSIKEMALKYLKDINVKIEKGIMSEAEVREWMTNTLLPIFQHEKETLVFAGYNWYIRKKK